MLRITDQVQFSTVFGKQEGFWFPK